MLIRFTILLIKRFLFKKKQAFDSECISNFRVGLFDLDLNFHMNNGRYLSIMDLARFDLLLRTGKFYSATRQGYYPLVMSESIIFKKSLNYLDGFQIKTHINGWDKNFFYISQKFIKSGEVTAAANVRACFKKTGVKGIISPAEMFKLLDHEHYPVELSDIAQKQIALDDALLPREKK